MIGILDYGCGNINSVIRMIQKLGGGLQGFCPAGGHGC